MHASAIIAHCKRSLCCGVETGDYPRATSRMDQPGSFGDALRPGKHERAAPAGGRKGRRVLEYSRHLPAGGRSRQDKASREPPEPPNHHGQSTHGRCSALGAYQSYSGPRQYSLNVGLAQMSYSTNAIMSLRARRGTHARKRPTEGQRTAAALPPPLVVRPKLRCAGPTDGTAYAIASHESPLTSSSERPVGFLCTAA
jgi:hypothetical protein